MFTKIVYNNDLNTSINVSGIGALCMAICLQGSLMNNPFLQYNISFGYVITGSIIQLIQLVIFASVCYKTNTLPEACYNASVFSCFFIPVCLPGKFHYCYIIRDIFFTYGIILMIPIVPTEYYRLLNDNNVSNNPSVALLQAVFSISCTAWLSNPISYININIKQNKNVFILHLWYILSQLGFFATLYCMYQRKSILLKIQVNHPSWAAFTFPFANTAIATSLYYHKFKSILSLGVWFEVYMILQAILAGVIIICVTTMYLFNHLFLGKLVSPTYEITHKAETSEINDISISVTTL